MLKIELLSKIVKNKIFLYLGTRYIVYAIQFVVFLLLANRLGPYHYGRWGFFLMICGYFKVVNFGIPNSVDVLLVQNRNNNRIMEDYVMSSMGAIGIQCILLSFLGIAYYTRPLDIFVKYDMGFLFFIICFFAVLYYFNSVFGKIYRIKNRLLELSINQSLFPVLILCASFLFEGLHLFRVLICIYVMVQLISFVMYIGRGAIPFGGHIIKQYIIDIYKKGFYLFLYNSCFYLILISTSTVISYSYSVEEYGLYTFSYSLGHSILLLLEAFTSIAFPKMLDKFYRGTGSEVKALFKTVQINYVSLSHGLMYIAFALFPLFISFFPKYSLALPALCLTGLSVLLNTNAFGYNSYLIANNDEKRIAVISSISLLLNIVVAFLLVKLSVPFYCVVISVMVSYFLFSYLCAWRAMSVLGEKNSIICILEYVFPFRLLLPYITGLMIVVLGLYDYALVPLIIYSLTNIKNIRVFFNTLKTILYKPKIVDLGSK